MKNKIYQKKYFTNVMVIQSNVVRMILGRNIPFVYPNCECTLISNSKIGHNHPFGMGKNHFDNFFLDFSNFHHFWETLFLFFFFFFGVNKSSLWNNLHWGLSNDLNVTSFGNIVILKSHFNKLRLFRSPTSIVGIVIWEEFESLSI